MSESADLRNQLCRVPASKDKRDAPKLTVLEEMAMVGCGHRDAPVEIRERLAFTPEAASDALEAWREQFPEIEAVLLSTCNRTELYVASEKGRLPHECQLIAFLCEQRGLPLNDIRTHMRSRTGGETVRHLFAVASALDSMVVGEAQILSQVKQAYQLATAGETTGSLTHALFQSALTTAKRVSTGTAIQQRRVSIPSVAVGEFATRIFERFDDKNVLVIGAGEMGEETLRYLRDRGVHDITVVNRGFDRALRLAEQWQGRARPWEELDDALVKADLVVSTTGAQEPIVDGERFRPIESARSDRPLFILDLAIPRDIAPSVGDYANVYLYSIDDLQEACDENRRERDRELPKARRIVEQAADEFLASLRHRATSPVIQRLREGWRKPMEDELQRLYNKLPELDEEAREEVARAFERLVNKLLHPPLESLRDEARNGVPHGLIDALSRLFKLKD